MTKVPYGRIAFNINFALKTMTVFVCESVVKKEEPFCCVCVLPKSKSLGLDSRLTLDLLTN